MKKCDEVKNKSVMKANEGIVLMKAWFWEEKSMIYQGQRLGTLTPRFIYREGEENFTLVNLLFPFSNTMTSQRHFIPGGGVSRFTKGGQRLF